MNNIEYVNYSDSYLDQIINLWNEELPFDQITKKEYIRQINNDPNFDSSLCILALDDDVLVGYGFGIKRKVPYQERGLEPSRGWINIVFVRKEYRNKSIATKIVNILEERLKSLGTKEITLCAYSPNYFTPGIDERYVEANNLFKKLGYVYKNIGLSMQRSLFDHVLSEETKKQIKDLEKENIIFKHYEDKYEKEFVEFVLNEFGAGWKNNVVTAIKNGEANDLIIMVLKDAHPIGFCMRKIDGHEDRFGPIGVKEEYRSKGLGSVLIEIMMNDMVKHQIHDMYFLWTLEARRFYERHGLKVYRQCNLYRKEI